LLSKSIPLIIFIIFFQDINAQEKKKEARKAAIYSAILPGAGQIYSRKYWKVPIVYTALTTTTYYVFYNHNQYIKYKEIYLNRINGNMTDEFIGTYTNDEVETLTGHYQRNKEISILFLSLSYFLNILDASVNVHLLEYNVNDDISININPSYYNRNNIGSLNLTINL